ncbi:hypothetical protein KIW84_057205 [Lathyrus oleraceus]|uniref:PB1-like domain-containing protein n=1 Tax=Pisum sativum TaxID=3888 RepID=A0A9D4X3K7_PEA|nr:hypothetical protein KIW84_057205 [Pisum sativum]
MKPWLLRRRRNWSEEDNDSWSYKEDATYQRSPLFISSLRFDCVIYHGGVFVEFNRLGYHGLEKVWQVDPDFWSYFEVLDGLKDLGYSKVESLWYYDAMDDNELVLLRDDAGTSRIKMIALINGNVDLYVMHPVYEEEQILSLENSVGSNGVEEDKLECDTLNDLNNGVKGTFDDFGTFDDLNNLGDKLDEGGTTGVKDTIAVDQEDSFENVNLDVTTEGINQKDSCQDGTTYYMLCDQEDDILDGPPYLVRFQKDSVAEGLICNQVEDGGLECNQEDEDGGNENNSALNVNFEDYDEDVICFECEL